MIYVKDILILTTTFPKSEDDFQTPKFVLDLGLSFQKLDYEVCVLTPNFPNGKKKETIFKLNVKRFNYFFPRKKQDLCIKGGVLTNLEKNKFNYLKVPFLSLCLLFNTLFYILKKRDTIINSHWAVPSGLVGAIMNKLFRTTHISTLHAAGVYSLKKLPLSRFIASFIMKGSSRIYPVSSEVKNVFLSILKNDKRIMEAENKMKILPMGVWIKKMLLQRENIIEIRKRNYINDDTFLILYIGRLVEKKGVEFLIEAIKNLVEDINVKIKAVKVYICGGGPKKDKLVEFVNNLGLNKIIEFKGIITDNKKIEYINMADIVVVPSIITKTGDTEGLPVVILESMAAAKPVIASNVGGIKDVVQDGENGFLVMQQKPSEIHDAILKIFQNPEKANEMSRKAFETIQNYDWSVIAEEYLSFIKND